MKEKPQQTVERKRRQIWRAVTRAEKAEERYSSEAWLLGEIEAAIKKSEHAQKNRGPYAKKYRELHRIAKWVRRTLVMLEAKKAALAKECLDCFRDYFILGDLIRRRDLDLPHQWHSINEIRQLLSRPLPDYASATLDKWQQRVLTSYSNEQIEQEMQSLGKRQLEGIRLHHGVIEYLLDISLLASAGCGSDGKLIFQINPAADASDGFP
jgi:hypothetical protein